MLLLSDILHKNISLRTKQMNCRVFILSNLNSLENIININNIFFYLIVHEFYFFFNRKVN